MIKISKKQKEYLVSINALMNDRGAYSELHISSKNKNSKGKTYYVPDYVAKYINKKI